MDIRRSAILVFLSVLTGAYIPLKGQELETLHLRGTVLCEGEIATFAGIRIEFEQQKRGTIADDKGLFSIMLPKGTESFRLIADAIDCHSDTFIFQSPFPDTLHLVLQPRPSLLEEVVVTGSLNAQKRSSSPIPVMTYRAAFFEQSGGLQLPEGLQFVNGLRSQVNCGVCNTTEIRINGLEGPYTLVLIDGMPVLGGLASVYGMMGIPQSMIERVEIIKGPASAIYGSEAVGGLINIITKTGSKGPKLILETQMSSWAEHQSDLIWRPKSGKRSSYLVGIGHGAYTLPKDQNEDGFTDISMHRRNTAFGTSQHQFKKMGNLKLNARYLHEDRWGGEMHWKPENRGGTDVYGESIYTSRWEFSGLHTLSGDTGWRTMFHFSGHRQNSAYGPMMYLASQHIAFTQISAPRLQLGTVDLQTALAWRYNQYDDNTPATGGDRLSGRNQVYRAHIPGLILEGTWTPGKQHKIITALRTDHHHAHGIINTPRVHYRFETPSKRNVLLLSAGSGYRVAHVFTEDHASLTGARTVVFEDALQPEQSQNIQGSWIHQRYGKKGSFYTLEFNPFVTRFSNQILPDYDQNPNEIRYANLRENAWYRGMAINTEMKYPSGLEIRLGGTYTDIHLVQNGVQVRPLFTERFSAVWNIGWEHKKTRLRVDYNGNLTSPMRLPLLGPLDPRPEYSPWWSIQNIRVSGWWGDHLEVFTGVRNLLNMRPYRHAPFLHARPHDPFDQGVSYDADGQIVPSSENPYALSFDPGYSFVPNQGIRFFAGVRYILD